MSLTFLITGGGKGIGRGLSRLLLQRGHRVFLLDNNPTELSHTTATLTSSFPHAISSQLCDVRQPAEITAAIDAARDYFHGHLDVLINNAAYTGGVSGPSISDLSLEEWNKSIETNLTGPMLVSQACIPLLRAAPGRKDGGAIINMSSTRALMSEADSEGYATTKAGLIGLTHALAVSLAPRGITVNAILPGWIDVAAECKSADEKFTDEVSVEDHAWHLSGRVGKVEDVVRTVEYLASARFVTGTEQVLDGGVTRKMVYPE